MRSSGLQKLKLFEMRIKTWNFRTTTYGVRSIAFLTTVSAHCAMLSVALRAFLFCSWLYPQKICENSHCTVDNCSSNLTHLTQYNANSIERISRNRHQYWLLLLQIVLSWPNQLWFLGASSFKLIQPKAPNLHMDNNCKCCHLSLST